MIDQADSLPIEFSARAIGGMLTNSEECSVCE
jgi:hypothetical protein